MKIIFPLLGVMVLLTLTTGNSQGQPSSLTNGLIAFYPFDGNANDSSGNGRNLTLNSCDLTNGIRGQSLNFSQSSSRADYLPSSQPQQTNAFAFSLWMKPNTLNRGFPEWIYLIEGSALSNNAVLRIGVNDGSVEPSFQNLGRIEFLNSGQGGSLTTYSTTSGILRTNAWNHIVVSANGSTEIAIYANGTLLQRWTNTPQLVFDQNDYFFGNQLGYTYPLQGQLDQIRVYNRPLTGSEVTSLYNVDRIRYVKLVHQSSTDLNNWQPFVTNVIETYSPNEFYRANISVSDTPPSP
jgi:hypothetical protein